MTEIIMFFEKVTNVKSEGGFEYLVFLLTITMFTSTVDWLFGWLNARFNKEVTFVSSVALYGIVKKMMYFIVLILFMFISFLVVPNELAFTSTIVLYFGYLFSEANSVLSHLGLTDDGKSGVLFKDFLNKIFKGDN